MIILLIPIGCPGSGKTTLKEYLKSKIPNFYSTERDYEFSIIRKTNSLKKTRRILFDKFENFMEEIISTNQENPEKINYVYFDSSNAKILGRDRIYKKIKPNKIIEINFQFTKQILLERVTKREHPTFPKESRKQEEMLNKINKSIEYSDYKDDRTIKIYLRNPKTLEELRHIICCHNIPSLA